jgi:hypothetical protein
MSWPWASRIRDNQVGLDDSDPVSKYLSMTSEQVKQAQTKAPFKPFTIFLSDQRHFEIQHPDFLWIIPGGRSLAVALENGAMEVIDLMHVTSLQLHETGIP